MRKGLLMKITQNLELFQSKCSKILLMITQELQEKILK